MQRILIAGCGDLGTALGTRLAARGAQAFGLRRDPSRLPAAITPVAADLADPRGLRAVPRAVDVLVYTAAAAGFDDGAYRSTYVDGMHNVLATLDRDRLRRIVFVSSTGVYGQDDGGWVDEDSPSEPAGFAGRRLLEAEALAAASGVCAVSVRCGGIYGAGRRRLIEQVRAGAGCGDAPVLWTNRIHRDDCVGVLDHVLGLDAPQPVYVAVDCEPAPQCAVMDWLAARIGVAAPPRGGAIKPLRGGNKRCSNRRLLASGYRFIHPTYREGYACELDAMGLASNEE